MEAAALTLAHSHARNASAETQKANTAVAKEEHEHAAGEFSNAAKSTEDTEALRILKLLEDHHHHLAHIIQQQTFHHDALQTNRAEGSATSEGESAPSTAAALLREADDEPASDAGPLKAGASTPTASPPIPNWRKPARDVPTSIASNLATARGIPSNQTRRGAPISPTVSAQNARGKIVAQQQQQNTRGSSPDPAASVPRQPRSKADATTATSRPPTTAADAPSLRSGRPFHSRSDEPFARFFSTFETVFNTLSAPLAFAGLPLGTEDHASAGFQSTSEKPSSSQPQQPQDPHSQNPDLSKLFSRAAIRALRDDHSFAPSESFYVVPSTGHTVSYANILSRSNGQNKSATSSADLDDGEYFVDASETPQPPSPMATRPPSSRRPGATAKRTNRTGKTIEELELENDALKGLLDAQSRRLHLWELSSQSQSQALQASLRAHGAGPKPAANADVKKMLAGARGPSDLSAASVVSAPTSATAAPSTSADTNADAVPKSNTDTDTAVADRVTELETLLTTMKVEKEQGEKDREKLKRENAKLQSVIARYRERWRELVNGARKRRDGQAAAEGQGENGKGTNASLDGGEESELKETPGEDA